MQNTISLDKLEENHVFLNKMYDIIRLVDPIQKIVVEYKTGKINTSNTICHDYWQSNKICDNCISVRAYLDNRCFQKLEHSPEAIMLVTALPIDNANQPLVLELLKNVTDTMMFGSGNYSQGCMLNNIISKLNDLTIKDELTGLYNRRYVNERLPADIVRASVESSPLSVIFLDVDNLKPINDTYGHNYGDEAIIKVMKSILNNITPEKDWAARFGGDEFIICLNHTDNKDAYEIAERIRKDISKTSISQEKNILITASLGIYTMAEFTLTADELISLADERLYKAKSYGKNCTISIN